MVARLSNDALEIGRHCKDIDYSGVISIRDYVGAGYGIASGGVRDFTKLFAAQTGILLDTVYTGKAMYGLFEEIKKEHPALKRNILFIHAGGLFGLFPQKELF